MLNDLKWWEKIYYPIYRFCNHYLDWRWFKWGYQRVTRGFSDRQTWSLDYTIAKFCAPRLRHMATHIHGCPSILEEYDGTNVDEGCKIWESHINKMARAFELFANDNDDLDYSDLEMVETGKNHGGCTGITIKSDPEKAKIRDEIIAARQKEIDEGLDLFRKYFATLWD